MTYYLNHRSQNQYVVKLILLRIHAAICRLQANYLSLPEEPLYGDPAGPLSYCLTEAHFGQDYCTIRWRGSGPHRTDVNKISFFDPGILHREASYPEKVVSRPDFELIEQGFWWGLLHVGVNVGFPCPDNAKNGPAGCRARRTAHAGILLTAPVAS